MVRRVSTIGAIKWRGVPSFSPMCSPAKMSPSNRSTRGSGSCASPPPLWPASMSGLASCYPCSHPPPPPQGLVAYEGPAPAASTIMCSPCPPTNLLPTPPTEPGPWLPVPGRRSPGDRWSGEVSQPSCRVPFVANARELLH
jgi:hypothetical protein